jgi:hypothetical protein
MSAPVPPSLPPTSAAPPASAPTVVRGTVLSLPPNVTLAQGQALAAQVVSSGNGQLVLATHLGPITVQSQASLPPGASVLLQVQAAGDAPQVSLQLPQPTAAIPAAPTRSTVPAAASSQPASPTVTTHVTEGSIVQAVVTRGIPPASVDAGQTQPAAAATTPAGTQPAGAMPPATPPLVAGSNLTLRVAAAAPPGSALPPAPPAIQPEARLFAAMIVGHRPGGAPVASVGTSEVVLSNAPPLPAGSRVLFEMLAMRPPLPSEPSALPSPFSGRWDTLAEALALLQRADPALARHVADSAIPNPGPKLAGSALFFLSAVFSGDIRRFLDSDAMRQLARAPGTLGARLSTELSQMQRPATDASGQDWRLFLVPLLTNEGLEHVRFMLHADDKEGQRQDDDAGTRFLIEADMSRLGPFQFDGLARRKHLDLVVRTLTELPPEMREEIRSIFGNTVTALGFSGTIAFRAVPKFEVSPVEQPSGRPKDLTV